MFLGGLNEDFLTNKHFEEEVLGDGPPLVLWTAASLRPPSKVSLLPSVVSLFMQKAHCEIVENREGIFSRHAAALSSSSRFNDLKILLHTLGR